MSLRVVPTLPSSPSQSLPAGPTSGVGMALEGDPPAKDEEAASSSKPAPPPSSSPFSSSDPPSAAAASADRFELKKEVFSGAKNAFSSKVSSMSDASSAPDGWSAVNAKGSAAGARVLASTLQALSKRLAKLEVVMHFKQVYNTAYQIVVWPSNAFTKGVARAINILSGYWLFNSFEPFLTSLTVTFPHFDEYVRIMSVTCIILLFPGSYYVYFELWDNAFMFCRKYGPDTWPQCQRDLKLTFIVVVSAIIILNLVVGGILSSPFSDIMGYCIMTTSPVVGYLGVVFILNEIGSLLHKEFVQNKNREDATKFFHNVTLWKRKICVLVFMASYLPVASSLLKYMSGSSSSSKVFLGIISVIWIGIFPCVLLLLTFKRKEEYYKEKHRRENLEEREDDEESASARHEASFTAVGIQPPSSSASSSQFATFDAPLPSSAPSADASFIEEEGFLFESSTLLEKLAPRTSYTRDIASFAERAVMFALRAATYIFSNDVRLPTAREGRLSRREEIEILEQLLRKKLRRRDELDILYTASRIRSADRAIKALEELLKQAHLTKDNSKERATKKLSIGSDGPAHRFTNLPATSSTPMLWYERMKLRWRAFKKGEIIRFHANLAEHKESIGLLRDHLETLENNLIPIAAEGAPLPMCLVSCMIRCVVENSRIMPVRIWLMSRAAENIAAQLELLCAVEKMFEAAKAAASENEKVQNSEDIPANWEAVLKWADYLRPFSRDILDAILSEDDGIYEASSSQVACGLVEERFSVDIRRIRSLMREKSELSDAINSTEKSRSETLSRDCNLRNGWTVFHYAMHLLPLRQRSVGVVNMLVGAGFKCYNSSKKKGRIASSGWNPFSLLFSPSVANDDFPSDPLSIIRDRRSSASSSDEIFAADSIIKYIEGVTLFATGLKMGLKCTENRLSRLKGLQDEGQRRRKELKRVSYKKFTDDPNDEHRHGEDLDIVFDSYEEKYWWWKFLSQFAERAALVIIVAGDEDKQSLLSLLLSLAVMATMLFVSWRSKPFVDSEQDSLDFWTRLTNVVNVAVGVVALGDYLGSSTDLICLVVISVINALNFFNIVYALNFASLLENVSSVISAVKLYRTKLKADESLRVSRLGRDLCVALAEGDTLKVVSLTSERSMDFAYVVPSLAVCLEIKGLISAGGKRSVLKHVKEGWSFCHFAAAVGDDHTLKLLISKAAPVNFVDVHSSSPLHIAYMFGSMKCARLLEQAGADMDFPYLEKQKVITPRMLVTEQSLLEAAEAHREKDLSLIVFLTTVHDPKFILSHSSLKNRRHDTEDEIYFKRRVVSETEQSREKNRGNKFTKIYDKTVGSLSGNDAGGHQSFSKCEFVKLIDSNVDLDAAFLRVIRCVAERGQWKPLFSLMSARYSLGPPPRNFSLGPKVQLDSFAAQLLADNIFLHSSIFPKSYSLNDNNIGDIGAKALARVLAKERCQLEEYSFDLQRNDISAEGVLALLTSVYTKGASISRLDFRGNDRLPEESLETMASLVSLNIVKGALVSLYLPEPCKWGISGDDKHVPFGGASRGTNAGNGYLDTSTLSELDIPLICAVLSKHKNATSVDFSNSDLQAPSLQILARCLMIPSVRDRVKELKLNGNRWLMSPPGSVRATEAFGEFSARLVGSAVEKLDIRSCHLGDTLERKETFVHMLMSAISSGGSRLQFLNLSDNEIAEASATSIIDALKGGCLPHLKALDLSDNRKFFESSNVCNLFCDSFEKCELISVIKLRNTSIAKDVCESLALLLANTKSLTFLDISKNPLFATGACHWLKHIEDHQNLRFIDLSSCKLTDNFCLDEVSNCLRKNSSLKAINLHSNFADPILSYDGIHEIVDQIITNVRWFSHIPCGDMEAVRAATCDEDAPLEDIIAVRLEFSDCDLIVDATQAKLHVTFVDHKNGKSFSFTNEKMQHITGCDELRQIIVSCDCTVTKTDVSEDSSWRASDSSRSCFEDITDENNLKREVAVTALSQRKEVRIVSVRLCSMKYDINLLYERARQSSLKSRRRFCGMQSVVNQDAFDDLVDFDRAIENRNRAVCALNVSCNFGPAGCMILSRALMKGCPFLTSINISKNRVGAKAIDTFCKAVLTSRIIVKVDISCNDIKSDGAKAVAVMLKKTKSLHSLNLSENSLDAYGAMLIADALTANRSLTFLDISNNEHIQNSFLVKGRVGEELCDEKYESTMEMAKDSCLEGGLYGSGGLDMVSSPLSQVGSELSYGLGTSLSVAKYADLLTLPAERVLSNHSGLSELAKALTSTDYSTNNTTLLTLILSGGSCKKMTADQAKDFQKMLESDTCSLTSLDLSSNELGKDTSHYCILDAFELNRSVTKLNLRNNFFGADGCRQFCHTLDDNSSLVDVDLSNNHVSGAAVSKELANAIARNQSITLLNVANNEIEDADLEAMQKHMEMLKRSDEEVSMETLVKQFESDTRRLDGVTSIFTQYRRKVHKKKGRTAASSPRLSAALTVTLSGAATSPRYKRLTYNLSQSDEARKFYTDYLRILKEKVVGSQYAFAELLCLQLGASAKKSKYDAGRVGAASSVENIPEVITVAMNELLFLEMDEAVHEICTDTTSENESQRLRQRHAALVESLIALCHVGDDKWRPKMHFAMFLYLQKLVYRTRAEGGVQYRCAMQRKSVIEGYCGMCESLGFASKYATAVDAPRLIHQIAKTLIELTQLSPGAVTDDTDTVHAILARSTERCAESMIAALKTVRAHDDKFESDQEREDTYVDVLTLLLRLLRQGSPKQNPNVTFDVMIANDLLTDLHEIVSEATFIQARLAALRIIDACCDVDEFIYALVAIEEETEGVTQTRNRIHRPFFFVEANVLLNWNGRAVTHEEENEMKLAARILAEVALLKSDAIMKYPDFLQKSCAALKAASKYNMHDLATCIGYMLRRLSVRAEVNYMFLASNVPQSALEVLEDFENDSSCNRALNRFKEHMYSFLFSLSSRFETSGKRGELSSYIKINDNPWARAIESVLQYDRASDKVALSVREHYAAFAAACFVSTQPILLFGSEEPLRVVNEVFEYASLFPASSAAVGGCSVSAADAPFSDQSAALTILRAILKLFIDQAGFHYQKDAADVFQEGRRVMIKFNGQRQYSPAEFCLSDGDKHVKYENGDMVHYAAEKADVTYVASFSKDLVMENKCQMRPLGYLHALWSSCYRLCHVISSGGAIETSEVLALSEIFGKLLRDERRSLIGGGFDDALAEGALNCVAILSTKFVEFHANDAFRLLSTRTLVKASSDVDSNKTFEAAVRYLSVACAADAKIIDSLKTTPVFRDFCGNSVSSRLGHLLNALLSPTPAGSGGGPKNGEVSKITCRALALSLLKRLSQRQSKQSVSAPQDQVSLERDIVESFASRIDILTSYADTTIQNVNSYPLVLTESLFTLSRRSVHLLLEKAEFKLDKAKEKDALWKYAARLIRCVQEAFFSSDVASESALNHAVAEVGRVLGVQDPDDIYFVPYGRNTVSEDWFKGFPDRLYLCVSTFYSFISKTKRVSLLPLLTHFLCVLPEESFYSEGHQYRDILTSFISELGVFDEAFLTLHLAPSAPEHERCMALSLCRALISFDDSAKVLSREGIFILIADALCCSGVQESAALLVDDMDKKRSWKSHVDMVSKLLFETDSTIKRALLSLNLSNHLCTSVVLRLLKNALDPKNDVFGNLRSRIMGVSSDVMSLLALNDTEGYFDALACVMFRMLPGIESKDRELTLVRNSWILEDNTTILETEHQKLMNARDELWRRNISALESALSEYRYFDSSSPYESIVSFCKQLQTYLERCLDKTSKEGEGMNHATQEVEKYSVLPESHVGLIRAVSVTLKRDPNNYDTTRKSLNKLGISFLKESLRIVGNADSEDEDIVNKIKSELQCLDEYMKKEYPKYMASKKSEREFCGFKFSGCTNESVVANIHLILLAVVRSQEIKSLARCADVCGGRLSSEKETLIARIGELKKLLLREKTTPLSIAYGSGDKNAAKFAVSADESLDKRERRLWHVTSTYEAWLKERNSQDFFQDSSLVRERFGVTVPVSSLDVSAFKFIKFLLANSLKGDRAMMNCEILSHIGEHMFGSTKETEKETESDLCSDYSAKNWIKEISHGLRLVFGGCDRSLSYNCITQSLKLLRLLRLIIENRTSWDENWFYENSSKASSGEPQGILSVILLGSEYFLRYFDNEVVIVFVMICEIVEIVARKTRRPDMLFKFLLNLGKSWGGSRLLPAVVRFQLLMAIKTCCERLGVERAKQLAVVARVGAVPSDRKWAIYDELLGSGGDGEGEWDSFSFTMGSLERYFMSINELERCASSGLDESDIVRCYADLAEVLSVDAEWNAAFINCGRIGSQGGESRDCCDLVLQSGIIPRNAFDMLISIFYFSTSGENVKVVTGLLLSLFSRGEWSGFGGVGGTQFCVEQINELMSKGKNSAGGVLGALGLDRLIRASDESGKPMFWRRLMALLDGSWSKGLEDAVLPACGIIAFASKESQSMRAALCENPTGEVATVLERVISLLQTRFSSTSVGCWALEIARDLIAGGDEKEETKRAILGNERVRVSLWESCSAYLLVSGSTIDTHHPPAPTMRTASTLLKTIAKYCSGEYVISSSLRPLLTPAMLLGHSDKEVVESLLEAMFCRRTRKEVTTESDEDENSENSEEVEEDYAEDDDLTAALDYCARGTRVRKKRSSSAIDEDVAIDRFENDLMIWRSDVFDRFKFESRKEWRDGLDALVKGLTSKAGGAKQPRQKQAAEGGGAKATTPKGGK